MADRVLVVSADDATAHAAEACLAAAAAAVLRERTASAGLAGLAVFAPDAAIVDAGAVDVPWPELVARLVSHGVGVVLLVPPGDAGAGVRGLRLGAEHFLARLPEPEHLAVAVAHTAAHARLRRRLAELEGQASGAARYEPRTLSDAEREQIERALRFHQGNRTRAARELGISRATLINKIRAYALEL